MIVSGRPAPTSGTPSSSPAGSRTGCAWRPGRAASDAIAGCVAIAMKRASLFGRAPTVHDLTMAFTLWGFLDDKPPADLVETRRKLFEGVAHAAHHYVELRELVDAVPDSTLRLTLDQAAEGHRAHWQGLLDLPDLPD